MNYLDMIRDMATGNGEMDPTEARSIINGAEDELEDLKAQVSERLPDGEDAPDTDRRRKPKSEISRQERAEMYSEWRDEGKDPNKEWSKLPE